ncbi:MAG: Mur ligase family protein [Bacteroidota bacterium]
MTYADAEATLLALPRFADQGVLAYEPGLERIEALLGAMGRPHERFRSVHVAGTNGKGSTASMVAAIGTAAGLRVGLHTSPHLSELTERMRLGGVPAPHEWVADAVTRFRPTFDAVAPSFFEATVALSFLYFAEEAVDLAVVEVGLGGRLDATNVLRPEAALVTHIGLDHTDLLGDTREAIAREKAGIAKPGTPLLSAAEGESVVAALRETTEARGGQFVNVRDEVTVDIADDAADGLVLNIGTPVRTYAGLRTGLAGQHQAWNAALAVRAAETALPEVTHNLDHVQNGLADVRKLSGLGGRCETYQSSPLILADVAHNADGLAAALAVTRAKLSSAGVLHVLFGAMQDKSLDALAEVLARYETVVLPVGLSVPRAASADTLAAIFRARGLRVVDTAGVPEGIDWFRRRAGTADGLLITGSHLTVARAHVLTRGSSAT